MSSLAPGACYSLWGAHHVSISLLWSTHHVDIFLLHLWGPTTWAIVLTKTLALLMEPSLSQRPLPVHPSSCFLLYALTTRLSLLLAMCHYRAPCFIYFSYQSHQCARKIPLTLSTPITWEGTPLLCDLGHFSLTESPGLKFLSYFVRKARKVRLRSQSQDCQGPIPSQLRGQPQQQAPCGLSRESHRSAAITMAGLKPCGIGTSQSAVLVLSQSCSPVE